MKFYSNGFLSGQFGQFGLSTDSINFVCDQTLTRLTRFREISSHLPTALGSSQEEPVYPLPIFPTASYARIILTRPSCTSFQFIRPGTGVPKPCRSIRRVVFPVRGPGVLRRPCEHFGERFRGH